MACDVSPVAMFYITQEVVLYQISFPARLVQLWQWSYSSSSISSLSSLATSGQSFSLLKILWSLQLSVFLLDWWHSVTSISCGSNHQDNCVSACNRWVLNLSLRQPSRAAICKCCPTQLSTLDFSPWILTVIIHCTMCALYSPMPL